MTPWTWWAGEIDEDTYGLAEAATREDAIREASQGLKPGDKFRIVEARASTAAQYEGSDCVPFLRTRNHEIITVGPVEVAPSAQTIGNGGDEDRHAWCQPSSLVSHGVIGRTTQIGFDAAEGNISRQNQAQPFAWYWHDQHGCLYITGDDRKPEVPAGAKPLYEHPPQEQMTGDIEAAATAAIKAAQDEITVDRIESSSDHSEMIRAAFVGAVSSAILAERHRCAEIASVEAMRRLNNDDGYPAARAHDFIVVARKIEREILKSATPDGLYAEGGHASQKIPLVGEHTSSFPDLRSYQATGLIEVPGKISKRDRQRLQSAFKKGVKEGRRIEREAALKGVAR